MEGDRPNSIHFCPSPCLCCRHDYWRRHGHLYPPSALSSAAEPHCGSRVTSVAVVSNPITRLRWPQPDQIRQKDWALPSATPLPSNHAEISCFVWIILRNCVSHLFPGGAYVTLMPYESLVAVAIITATKENMILHFITFHYVFSASAS